MTTQTEDLIKEFAAIHDVKFIPSIIIGMQEEDNVGTTVSFKNCFRRLRNFAAHEPATITSQLTAGSNANNMRIVFEPNDNSGNLVMGIEQLTAWMFEMYLITGNIAYIVFWKNLMQIIFPKLVYKHAKTKFTFKVTTKYISEFARWKEFMCENYGDIWCINPSDQYVINMLSNNPRVFWRMALPDIFLLIRFYLSGDIELADRANIQFYVNLFKLWE